VSDNGYPQTVEVDARERLQRPEAYVDGQSKECDVVMKGGITSGVVYPLAVCELATRYRLKNVGGTSAGALAAVAAAAAEFGREASLTDAPAAGSGFVGLAALPDWIGGKGNLLSLFQPSRRTAPLFGLLLAFTRPRPGRFPQLRRTFGIVGRLLGAGFRSRHFYVPVLAAAPGVVLIWALGWGASWHWAVGLGLLVAIALGFGSLAALVMPRRPDLEVPCTPREERRRRASIEEQGRRARSRQKVAQGLILVVAGAAAVLLHNAAANSSLAWGMAAGLFTVCVGIIGGSIASTILGAGRALPDNMFGLVSGSNEGAGDALTEWLTRLINQLAGLEPDGEPLTFGQLWEGPSTSRSDDPECAPFVNLEMLTTCLTKGRPYRLPNELNRQWFFHPDEMARLFPPRVVEHLKAFRHEPMPTSRDQQRWEQLVSNAADDGLVPLPDPEGMPVVVAARMSLSFPLLISAVPLYAVDYSCLPEDGKPRPERCWFSDGGITSNFPVTFFDAMLPRRPTFAINLRKFHPAHPQSFTNECDNVWMPETNDSGILEWWTRPASSSGPAAVGGYLRAILDTMQNWVDNRQLQVPGYRDRVIHISHNDKEGGVNLDMPTDVLAKLSERGRCAGARLVEFYTSPPQGERVVSWENHRWVRMRSALGLMEETLASIARAYPTDYAQDLRRPVGKAPSYQFGNIRQRTLALQLMEGRDAENSGADPFALADLGLVQIGDRLAEYAANDSPRSLRNGTPSPAPQLRIAPGYERRCSGLGSPNGRPEPESDTSTPNQHAPR
jgi:predicted acylesterase/phospholipase RssA